MRARVALALALACLVVVGALGVTLYAASEDMEESLINELVSEEMNHVIQRHREDGSYRPQPSSNFQSYIVRDAAGTAALPPFLRGLAPGRHELYIGNEEHHVLVRQEGDTRYYVAYEVGLHEKREQQLKLLVLLSVLGAMVASLALGYWLSGLLVSQVTDLAARVAGLEPGEQGQPLAREGQDAEVAMLARAFDDYQERIEQMIRREQEFTSNASHELRTPLTAIRTSCELLLSDPALDDRARTRLEWIDAAATRMSEQIQTLLLLARGQAPGEVEPVVLAECVHEAVQPHLPEIARKGLSLEVDIAADAVLNLNYPALRLVVGNLLRNAVQYTDRGSIRVGYGSGRLSVADSGKGIGGESIGRIFERFFRVDAATGGSGLGLAIVKRVCDHYGWKIEVDSQPGHGSTFRISFA